MNRKSARFICALIVLFVLFFCTTGALALLPKPVGIDSPPSQLPYGADVCLFLSAGDMWLAVMPSGVQLIHHLALANRFSGYLFAVAATLTSRRLTWLSEAQSGNRQFSIQSYVCHPHQGPPVFLSSL